LTDGNAPYAAHTASHQCNAPHAQERTMITSLEVASWPMIRWSAQNIHRLSLVHFESVPERNDRSTELWTGLSGRSVWGGMSADGMLGLSWQWAQISPGVFALLDPMAIDSNVVLLGSDGSRLSPMASAMVLNCIVAQLGWQTEAARSAQHDVRPRIDAVLPHCGHLAS
jgi:hypothetical protein